MTKEEALEILTHNWTRVDNPNYTYEELDNAFHMAIEALSTDAVSREEREYLNKTFPNHDGEWIDITSICSLEEREDK